MKTLVSHIPQPMAWALVAMSLILSQATALALETAMQDDFSSALTKWSLAPASVFTISSGTLTGSLAANTAAAHAEVSGFSEKDVVVEFDLRRFAASSNHFDLVLRQAASTNTRVRFAAAAQGPNYKITGRVMEPGSNTNSFSLGQTSFTLGSGAWATLRVRINDSRLQFFAKTQTGSAYEKVGEYTPGATNYISSGAGAVRLLIPQSTSSNSFTMDNFRIRRADSGRKVFADFHGYRYTREHDGQLGNWKQEARSPQAPYHIANYNADLMDENGIHQLAAPGSPAIGMHSYNDPDYAEYHVLTARMAGIDGFLHEYGCSAGLTDADVQLLQATSEKYGLEFGINWLDGFYYPFIQNTADYQAWCTANSKDPALDATKLEYIPVVFQQLIHWVYDKPNAATVGGKPLMPIFNGSPLTAAEFATLKTKTYDYRGQADVVSPFLMPRRAPIGLATSTDPNIQKFYPDPTGWETHSDGSFGWKPLTERPISSAIYKSQGDERDSKEFARAHVEGMLLTTNDRVNIAGVMPGFDNQYNAAWGQWAVELLDRKNGLTYTEAWEQYLRDRDVIDAVLIPTWSDHTEGSGIEPMSSYGDRELRATAKYSARFKGLDDVSASLDFTLPAQLFELRKLVKFLEAAGTPTALLATHKNQLDTAGQDLAAGNYSAASTNLATARTALEGLRDNNIRNTTYSSQYFTGVEASVANNSDQYIDIPDAIADLVRARHFVGTITFEYLDNSTYAANKTLFLVSYPNVASTGKPGENRSIQMQLRHGNGNGLWKTARVALNKKNLRLDHHVTPGALPIDLYFSSLGGASNGGTIRNVTVALITYEYDSGVATESLADGAWSAPATWANGIPVDGGAAGVIHNVTFQAGDSWTGGAAKGLLIGYDGSGADWGMAGSGSGTLHVTGGSLSTGYLGLGAGLAGGNQTGTLDISGGQVTADSDVLVGWSTADGSAIDLSGGEFILAAGASPATIGYGAAAAFRITGGTASILRPLSVQNNSALQISGSGVMRLANGGALHVASGTLSIGSGGLLELATGGTLAASPTVEGGTLRFSGGTGANSNNLFVSNGGTLDVNGRTLPAGTWANFLPYADGDNRILNSSANPAVIADGNTLWLWNTASMTTTIETIGDLTIDSWITGSQDHHGGITKTGPGMLVITNPANDYTGHTVVSAGTLRLNQLRLADSADVRLASGVVLDLNFSGTDTIRSLYINGVKQAGGTWGSTGSSAQNKSSLIIGNGMLQVSAGAKFADWAVDHGIPGEPAIGDFDNDGLKNLTEYALGTDPVIPSISPVSLVDTAVSYPKGPSAVANGDVSYVIETSTTLEQGSWQPVIPDEDTPLSISYTLPPELPRCFARLVVTQFP